MSKRIVLDSSAILAVALGERGAETVVPLLDRCVVSAVNLAETIDVLSRRPLDSKQIQRALDALSLEVIAFDEPLARRTGELASRTRQLGLSLGDRACLTLAEKLGSIVLTADRRQKDATTEIEVKLIR